MVHFRARAALTLTGIAAAAFLSACGADSGPAGSGPPGASAPRTTGTPLGKGTGPTVSGEGLIGDAAAVRWLDSYSSAGWYPHARHVYWMGQELWIDTNLLPTDTEKGVAACDALTKYQASLGRPDGAVRVNGQDGLPLVTRTKAKDAACTASA
jgi:hypothetical protein